MRMDDPNQIERSLILFSIRKFIDENIAEYEVGHDRSTHANERRRDKDNDTQEKYVDTDILTWKPLKGKNHGSPQTPNYHYMRGIQSGDTKAMTSCSWSLPGGGYNCVSNTQIKSNTEMEIEMKTIHRVCTKREDYTFINQTNDS